MGVEGHGYSGRPLVHKLGIKSGQRVHVRSAPADYFDWVTPLPDGVILLSRLVHRLDFIHWFVRERKTLEQGLDACRCKLVADGMLWISWPKKSSAVPSDVTEDVIRDVALPLGLVDVKVCAVNDTWSALKLVVRKALRKNHPNGRL